MHAYGPRKQRQQWAFQFIIGITLVVVLGILGVRYLFNTLFSEDDSAAQSQSGSVYTDGSTIILGGQIRGSTDLKEYSHVLVTAQQEKFGLKSTTLDLSQWTGTVQVKGTVTNSKNGMTIITVTDIIGQKSDNQGGDANDPSNNDSFYWFQSSSIAFDLSMSKGFTVDTSANGDLILKDTTLTWNDPTIFTISPFVCKKWDTLKDCEALQTRFEQTKPETFVSSAGISYFNLPETKTRVAIFKNRVWFYLSPSKPEWTSFTSMIRFLDKPTIEEAVKEKYQDYCYDLNSRMTAVTSLRLQEQQQGLWIATLSGPSSIMSPATCTILIRLGTRLTYFPQRYIWWTDGAATGTWTAQQQVITAPWTPTTTGTATPPAWSATAGSPTAGTTGTPTTPPSGNPLPSPTSAPTTAPAWVVSGTLSLPSVRGYTIYFSQKWIRYNGEILETPIMIGDAKCIYKLDIYPWQAANDASPATTVYECIGTPSGNNVNQLVFIGQVDTMTFVLQHNTTALKNLEVYVAKSGSSE